MQIGTRAAFTAAALAAVGHARHRDGAGGHRSRHERSERLTGTQGSDYVEARGGNDRDPRARR